MDYCDNCSNPFDQEELTLCGDLLLCDTCQDECELDIEDGFHEIDLEDEDEDY